MNHAVEGSHVKRSGPELIGGDGHALSQVGKSGLVVGGNGFTRLTVRGLLTHDTTLLPPTRH
jgi:hypothetical protein